VKSVICSLLSFVAVATTSLAQTPQFVARMSNVKLEQCRRAQHLYEFDLEGTFEFENTSDETILIPSNIDVVRSVEAASSPQELQGKQYSFVMVQEFGGNANAPVARLEDFVVLKPKQKTAIQMSLVLSASTDPKETSKVRLHSGKQWVLLEFLTLPFSLWNSGDFELWKKKWSSSGVLMNKYVVTDPFPLDVVPDANAANCNAQNTPTTK
jgi:hypothetical protein